MDTPRVNPVGVVEYPAGYSVAPRVHSPKVRVAATLILVAFVGATVGTSVYSLATYCLTTWASSLPFLAS